MRLFAIRNTRLILTLCAALFIPASASATAPVVTLTSVTTSGTFSPSNLGTTATGTLTATFQFTTGGTIGAPIVLTQGAAGLDFTKSSASTCSSTSYTTGATCTVVVNFKPIVPGQRFGAAQIVDASGNPLATANFSAIGTGPITYFQLNPTIVTGPSGFSSATSIAADGNYNLYVLDSGAGTISKFAGVSLVGASATKTVVATGLSGATSIVLDGAGNLFVSDSNNNAIKEIVAVNGNITATSTIQTVVSSLSSPTTMTIDGSGNLFVAAFCNGCNYTPYYEVPSNNGTVSAASTPALIQNNTVDLLPTALGVDPAGNLYIGDSLANALFKVTAVNGTITTAQQPVQLTQATFYSPSAVQFDAAGDVIVSDSSKPIMTEFTTAGAPISTSSTAIPFPTSLKTIAAFALAGPVAYFVDGTTNTVYAYILSYPSTSVPLTFQSTQVGAKSADSPQTAKIQNGGNGNLTLGAITSSLADFVIDPSSVCANGSILTPSSTCTLGIDFKPTAPGTRSGTITVLDSDPTGTYTFAVSGTATPGLVITPSSVTANYGTSTINLTASLSYPGVKPTGTVTFQVGTLGTQVATCTGSASPLTCTYTGYSISTLAAGTYAITASVAGDANYASVTNSTSATLSLNKLTATLNTSSVTITYGTSTINLTTMLTYSGTRPTGAVTFSVNSGTPVTATCTGSSSPLTCTYNGYNVSSLSSGTYSIAASLAADTYYSAATGSGTLTINQPIAQTISFTLANPTVTYAAQTITLTATGGASGNPVTFSITGGTGAANLSGSNLTITKIGTIQITANQAGSTTYAAATPVTQTLTVNAATVTETPPSFNVPYEGSLPSPQQIDAGVTFTGFVGNDTSAIFSGTSCEPNFFPEGYEGTEFSPAGTQLRIITESFGASSAGNYKCLLVQTSTITFVKAAAPPLLTLQGASVPSTLAGTSSGIVGFISFSPLTTSFAFQFACGGSDEISSTELCPATLNNTNVTVQGTGLSVEAFILPQSYSGLSPASAIVTLQNTGFLFFTTVATAAHGSGHLVITFPGSNNFNSGTVSLPYSF